MAQYRLFYYRNVSHVARITIEPERLKT